MQALLESTDTIVEVYKNLNNGQLSIRKANGNVIGHHSLAFVERGKFVIQPAGRAKVLATRQKNVHAWVKGIYHPVLPQGWETYPAWNQAAYNPYKADHFYDRARGNRVDTFKFAVVTVNGVYYVSD